MQFANLITKFRKAGTNLRVALWRRTLLRHGVAAGTEHIGALRHMNALRTIVDIGANRGQFALAALQVFPDSQVVSFEPLPGPARKYRAIFSGDVRVCLHEAAVGPERGWAEMYVSAHDDSSSLLQITPLQNLLFAGTQEVDRQRVEIIRLGDVLPKSRIDSPALLKIDVQGFELKALLGCEDQLICFEWAYVECSFMELYAGQALADAVIEWFQGRGLALVGVYNLIYDRSGRAIQGDFLFRRLNR